MCHFSRTCFCGTGALHPGLQAVGVADAAVSAVVRFRRRRGGRQFQLQRGLEVSSDQESMIPAWLLLFRVAGKGTSWCLFSSLSASSILENGLREVGSSWEGVRLSMYGSCCWHHRFALPAAVGGGSPVGESGERERYLWPWWCNGDIRVV